MKFMNLKKLLGIAMALLFTCFMLAACNPPAPSVTVESIRVTKMPDKVNFYVGDEFSAAGGEITAKLSNGGEDVVAMTAEGVTMTMPDMAQEGTKSITITYGGQDARFNVSVTFQKFTVKFDLNYTGAPSFITETIVKGDKAALPGSDPERIDFPEPSRENYIFDGWFIEPELANRYNFDTAVTADIVLYAAWLSAEATYYNAYFNANYEGASGSQNTVRSVEENTAIQQLPNNPSRTGYTFDGWYEDAAGTVPFILTSVFTADKTLYAKWTKTHSGLRTWTFEAENTNLDNKSGPDLSGVNYGAGMIMPDTTASGGLFVSNLFAKGLFLDFYIVSDIIVNNITLTARFSIQYYTNEILNMENYIITVNGKPVEFSLIHFVRGDYEVAPFQDYVISTTVSFIKGVNEIKFITNDDENPMGSATAFAPVIDCIKLTATDAVLIWDGGRGLPKAY